MTFTGISVVDIGGCLVTIISFVPGEQCECNYFRSKQTLLKCLHSDDNRDPRGDRFKPSETECAMIKYLDTSI